ncbi:hypothetical protein D3C86_1498840 [compost metagenome]
MTLADFEAVVLLPRVEINGPPQSINDGLWFLRQVVVQHAGSLSPLPELPTSPKLLHLLASEDGAVLRAELLDVELAHAADPGVLGLVRGHLALVEALHVLGMALEILDKETLGVFRQQGRPDVTREEDLGMEIVDRVISRGMALVRGYRLKAFAPAADRQRAAPIGNRYEGLDVLNPEVSDETGPDLRDVGLGLRPVEAMRRRPGPGVPGGRSAHGGCRPPDQNRPGPRARAPEGAGHRKHLLPAGPGSGVTA